MKDEEKKPEGMLENYLSLDLENDAIEVAKSYARAKSISFDLAVNELILRAANLEKAPAEDIRE